MSTSTSISPSVRRGRSSRILTAIVLIAIAGAVISSLSLYHHYGTSKTAFCNFGESFNCDIVNRSTYSTALGVPVALIGILGYLVILSFATVYRSKAETPALLLIISTAGLIFSLYLTYVEKFVLATWCILCLTSLTLILAEAILSALLATRKS